MYTHLEEYIDEILALKEMYKEKVKESEKKTFKIESLEYEIKSKNIMLSNLANEIIRLKEERPAIKDSIESLAAKNRELEDENKVLQAENKQLIESLGKKQDRIAMLKIDLSGESLMNTMAKDVAKKYKEQNNNLEAHYIEKCNELNKLKDEYAMLSEQVEKLLTGLAQ